MQLWIECVPVKELRQVKVEFPIPDLKQYYYCDVWEGKKGGREGGREGGGRREGREEGRREG